MTERDDSELLSAWLDGELNPTEEEIVRRRLDDDPDFAAELKHLRSASDATRAHFESEEAALPDLEVSQEDFIRTTLSGSTLGDRIERRPWWTGSWARAAAGVVLITGIIILVRLADSPETRAASLVEAAEAALKPANFMSIVIERPGLLGRRPPVHVLYGADGRWVVEAEDSLRVPGRFRGRERAAVRLTHRGRIHVGSDGGRIWLWLEGADVVKVFEIDTPLPLMTYFRTFLDEAPNGNQQTPLLNWGRVQDVLEGVAHGRLKYVRAGEETVNNERLVRYDVTLDARATSRVWISPADRAVRRVKLGLLTLSFDEPREVPEPAVFHWSSRAPAGVRVQELR